MLAVESQTDLELADCFCNHGYRARVRHVSVHLGTLIDHPTNLVATLQLRYRVYMARVTAIVVDVNQITR